MKRKYCLNVLLRAYRGKHLGTLFGSKKVAAIWQFSRLSYGLIRCYRRSFSSLKSNYIYNAAWNRYMGRLGEMRNDTSAFIAFGWKT